MKQQITSIESAGFAFCRYGVAILVWVAFIFRIKWLVGLVFVILLLSALLTVKYAPMIVIWRYTFGKLFKSRTEILNVKAMRFAHSLGTVISGICLLFLYFGSPLVGWIILGFLAVMKTISAFGFCPASKVYVCMSNGSCCAFSRKVKEIRDRK